MKALPGLQTSSLVTALLGTLSATPPTFKTSPAGD